MVSDPSGNKADVRTIATTALQILPIVLVVIYLLEYTYAFQFLLQFGVTPEEVGISEIKLLSRAAILALLILGLYGSGFFLVAIVFTAAHSIAGSSRTGLLYSVRKSTRKSTWQRRMP